MKKLLYGLVGTLVYVAPLILIYMNSQGTKKICAELEKINAAIENLKPTENHDKNKNLHG